MMFGSKKRREQKHAAEYQAAKRQLRDQLLELMSKVESGVPIDERLPYGESWYQIERIDLKVSKVLSKEELQRLQKARTKQEADISFPKEFELLRSYCQKMRNATGLPERVDQLSYFVQCYRNADKLNHSKLSEALGITLEEAVRQLDDAVHLRHEQLMEVREDFEGFKALGDFIQKSISSRVGLAGDWVHANLKDAGIDRLPYPDDWNDLVVKFYRDPPLELFADLPECSRGEIRHLAAEALRDDDFTKAQIALACCNSDPKTRALVGDVLTAELAKLVARHRVEAGEPAPHQEA